MAGEGESIRSVRAAAAAAHLPKIYSLPSGAASRCSQEMDERFVASQAGATRARLKVGVTRSRLGTCTTRKQLHLEGGERVGARRGVGRCLGPSGNKDDCQRRRLRVQQRGGRRAQIAENLEAHGRAPHASRLIES